MRSSLSLNNRVRRSFIKKTTHGESERRVLLLSPLLRDNRVTHLQTFFAKKKVKLRLKAGLYLFCQLSLLFQKHGRALSLFSTLNAILFKFMAIQRYELLNKTALWEYHDAFIAGTFLQSNEDSQFSVMEGETKVQGGPCQKGFFFLKHELTPDSFLIDLKFFIFFKL